MQKTGYNYSTGRYEFVDGGYIQDFNFKPVPQKVLDMVNSDEEYQEDAARAAEEMAAKVAEYMDKVETGRVDVKNIAYSLKMMSKDVHKLAWLRVDGGEYEIDLLACTVTRTE